MSTEHSEKREDPGTARDATSAAEIRHTRDFERVFATELEELSARREAAGLDSESLRAADDDAERATPSVARGIVGMAISGGGIRSSTFSLGVVQGLEQAGVFRKVDYISTVSGGGYTGSMLSSLLNDPAAADAAFPLAKPGGKAEPAALLHVRNRARYLDPGGLLGSLRLPTIVIRGLLLNFVLLLPYVMLAVILTEIVHEFGTDLLYELSTWNSALEFLARDNVSLYFVVPILAVLYIMAVSMSTLDWTQRDRREQMTTMILFLSIVLVLLAALGSVVDWAIETPLYGEFGLVARLEAWWADNVWYLVGLVALFSIAMKLSPYLSRFGKKLLVLLISIMGPSFIFLFYLFLCITQLDSPFMDSRPLAAMLGAADQGDASSDVATTVSPKLAFQLGEKGIDYHGLGDVPAVYCRDQEVWMVPREDQLACPIETLCGIPDDDVQHSCGYRLRPRGDHVEVIGANLRLGDDASDQTLLSDLAFIGLALFLLVINYLLIDVNFTSPHTFYRDRLSRLYLIELRRTEQGVEVESTDKVKLSELSRTGSIAPYHLLNATLNLQGNQQLSERGRQADVFFFSKHFCGSTHTGYGATATVEDWDPHVSLGTAMAISAAAAAPNMGSMTLRPVVFIMTLLNVRLGYWVPNPAMLGDGSRPARWRRRPGLRYLMREAMGALDAKSLLVNVSDGGHLENLGAYELVRRRCRVILVIDGEADPTMSFNGLVTLMRMARIDLGVDIRIDLARLMLGENGYSQAHFAIGTIDYGVAESGERETGHLVYIKSSLVGDEIPVLRKYRAENPTYPHESTADQFFDEVQFEVYRLLGAEIAAQLIDDPAFVDVMDERRGSSPRTPRDRAAGGAHEGTATR